MPREHWLRSNLSAAALLGSTGALGKLMNRGTTSGFLKDVAADMLNLRDTRIARETPVLRGARIAPSALVIHAEPIDRESPRLLTMTSTPVMPPVP